MGSRNSKDREESSSGKEASTSNNRTARSGNKSNYRKQGNRERGKQSRSTGSRPSRNDGQDYLNGPGGSRPFTLPYSDGLGTPIQLSCGNNIARTLVADRAAFPGVMRISYCPTFGRMTDYNDAVNRMILNLHTAMRYGQSYSHTYTSSFLGKVLFMCDQMMTALNISISVYGAMNYYSTQNRYMPLAYLQAMGFDGNTFIPNKDQFYEWIVAKCNQANIIRMPKYAFFSRHAYLHSQIFMDAPDVKAQAYVFRPEFLYHYRVTATEAYLAPVATLDGATMPMWMEWVDTMFDSILNTAYDDLCIIGGDFQRYFGSENLFDWNSLIPTRDYQTPMNYDPLFCDMIHNADWTSFSYASGAYPARDSLVSWDIYTDTSSGALVAKPGLFFPNLNADQANRIIRFYADHIIDSPSGNVTPEWTADATRFMAYAIYGQTELPVAGSAVHVPLHVGFELITTIRVYHYDLNEFNGTTTLQSSAINNVYVASAYWLLNFSSYPSIWSHTVGAGGTNFTQGVRYNSTNVYSIVNQIQFAEMVYNRLCSIYNVPILGVVKGLYNK